MTKWVLELKDEEGIVERYGHISMDDMYLAAEVEPGKYAFLLVEDDGTNELYYFAFYEGKYSAGHFFDELNFRPDDVSNPFDRNEDQIDEFVEAAYDEFSEFFDCEKWFYGWYAEYSTYGRDMSDRFDVCYRYDAAMVKLIDQYLYLNPNNRLKWKFDNDDIVILKMCFNLQWVSDYLKDIENTILASFKQLWYGSESEKNLLNAARVFVQDDIMDLIIKNNSEALEIQCDIADYEDED